MSTGRKLVAAQQPRWRQWSEGDAIAALREWSESGMTAESFAAVKGVSSQRLYYWAKRLGKTPKAETVKFAAVTIAEAGTSPPSIAIDVDGMVVRSHGDIDVDRLARLIKALRRAAREC